MHANHHGCINCGCSRKSQCSQWASGNECCNKPCHGSQCADRIADALDEINFESYEQRFFTGDIQGTGVGYIDRVRQFKDGKMKKLMANGNSHCGRVDVVIFNPAKYDYKQGHKISCK